jgi:hypothetical protein
LVKGRNTTQKHIEDLKETDLNIKNKYITNVYQKINQRVVLCNDQIEKWVRK